MCNIIIDGVRIRVPNRQLTGMGIKIYAGKTKGQIFLEGSHGKAPISDSQIINLVDGMTFYISE